MVYSSLVLDLCLDSLSNLKVLCFSTVILNYRWRNTFNHTSYLARAVWEKILSLRNRRRIVSTWNSVQFVFECRNKRRFIPDGGLETKPWRASVQSLVSVSQSSHLDKLENLLTVFINKVSLRSAFVDSKSDKVRGNWLIWTNNGFEWQYLRNCAQSDTADVKNWEDSNVGSGQPWVANARQFHLCAAGLQGV